MKIKTKRIIALVVTSPIWIIPFLMCMLAKLFGYLVNKVCTCVIFGFKLFTDE